MQPVHLGRTAALFVLGLAAATLKALAWEDAQGQSWLGYNDPAWVAQRHGVGACPVVENLTKALGGLADAATKSSR